MSNTINSDSVAQDQLKAFVERIERMEEEKKAIADDIREIYAEAKGNGFDVPVIRMLIKIRKQDHAERMEREAILDLYLAALGMQAAPADDDNDDPATSRRHGVEVRHSALNARSESVSASTAQNPVANVGEGANGATAAASIDPASREVDGADHQQPAASGITGDAAAASPKPTWDDADEPGREASAASCSTSGASPQAFAEGEGARPGALSTHSPETAQPGAYSAETEARPDRPEPTGDSFSGSGGPNGEVGSVEPVHQPSAAETPAPGVVYREKCPPAPVVWHDYARCWPEMFGLRLTAFINDIEADGVKKPIVKIGDQILDGRSRYCAARELGIDYPVVQYAGDDALADSIRWNLSSGRMMTMAERRTIATKLAKFPENASRASEIAQLFGLELAVTA